MRCFMGNLHGGCGHMAIGDRWNAARSRAMLAIMLSAMGAALMCFEPGPRTHAVEIRLMQLSNRGVGAAFGAAVLFGLGTPLAKLLLGETSPWLLAALLYLGSGVGLFVFRWLTRAARVRLSLI